MPIHLPPISRRRFLAGSAAALAGGLAPRWSLAAEKKTDPHLFALVSDTHVAANPDETSRGIKMTDNFRRVSEEILGLNTQPALAIVNGDCAYLHGLKKDYEQFAKLIDPLRTSGLPLHLGMGNHDDRGTFAEVLAALRPEHPPVTGRIIEVIPAERANWFLLDTLRKTNDTPGELGAEQVEWLGKALDEHDRKPAIVIMHHNPALDAAAKLTGGLIDTLALLDVLRPRNHVKALVYGHTHDWRFTERDGIHLINLPPTAYVFAAGRPNGWVTVDLRDDGATFNLHALDKNHPEHNKPRDLKWRAA